MLIVVHREYIAVSRMQLTWNGLFLLAQWAEQQRWEEHFRNGPSHCPCPTRLQNFDPHRFDRLLQNALHMEVRTTSTAGARRADILRYFGTISNGSVYVGLARPLIRPLAIAIHLNILWVREIGISAGKMRFPVVSMMCAAAGEPSKVFGRSVRRKRRHRICQGA